MHPLSRRALKAAAAIALLTPAAASAQNLDYGLGYAVNIGLPTLDVRALAVGGIRCLLGIMGFVLVLKIIHGGFLMMTHGGSEEARAQAVGMIKDSVIGIVIVMTSSAIVQFVVNAVLNATGAFM